jgi:hypothetical protein
VELLTRTEDLSIIKLFALCNTMSTTDIFSWTASLCAFPGINYACGIFTGKKGPLSHGHIHRHFKQTLVE